MSKTLVDELYHCQEKTEQYAQKLYLKQNIKSIRTFDLNILI